MHIPHNYIEKLTLFGLGQVVSPSIVACKTGSLLATANRAIVGNAVTSADLAALDQFYAGTPYVVWVSTADTGAKAQVVQSGLSLKISYPVMGITMDRLRSKPVDEHMLVRPVASDDEIFNAWIPLIAKNYFPQLGEGEQKKYSEQFAVFIRYLQQNLPRQDLSFYLGLIDNVPVATSLFVRNSGFVGVHWVGTLPAFRNRGMGYVVTNLSLQTFKAQRVETALLFASPSGFPVYERMGFERLVDYEVYTRRTPA